MVIFQRTMRLLRTIATLTLLLAGAALWPAGASAQEINFDQIDKFKFWARGRYMSVRHQKPLSMIASGTS